MNAAPQLTTGRVPAANARRWQRSAYGLCALGAAAAGAALISDPRRFAFTYLVGFCFVATLGVGGLIFVLLQHLTRAGWSSAARRQMEWLASALPLVALLFVPLALLSSRVYEWMEPLALQEKIVANKHAYLNAPAFFGRSGFFFVVWSLLALLFARTSRRQDTSEMPEIATANMQRWAAPAILVTGITVSFAGFDWLMSLDPRWYSTIFGIYVIAGAIVGSLALLALCTLAIERLGAYGPVSTVEHRHDIGKLLFGFTVFWAYIAFCQYFLIWYAGIPEETIFFKHRWIGSWKTVSATLAIGHFLVPFVLLLSRAGKRSPLILGAAATLILAMHYLDLYWLVMPTLDHGAAHPSWIDGAGLLLPLGVLVAWLARRASQDPVYPLRDPRLPEAIRLENF